MINSNLLKAKFKEKGLTQEEVANAVGMHPSTLSMKVNNTPGYVFTLNEVERMKSLLDIKNKECIAIFFTD